MIIATGSTDVTLYFKLQDPTTGAPETGLTIADLDLSYVRDGAAAVKSDLSTPGGFAVDSAHTDNAAIQVESTNAPGLYRVDVPDAAFAAGVGRVQVVVKGAAIDPAVLEVELAAWLTAATGATVKADVTAISGDATAADNLEAATDGNTYNVGGGAVVAASVSGAVGSVTGAVGSVVGHTAQTGDSFARLGAPAGASVSADIADVPTVAEFGLRTLPSDDYVVVGDTLARVTLVDTTTTNTDMRGTNSAALAATALSNLVWTDAKAGYLTGAVALEATLTAIKGAGWSTETLAAIDVLIDTVKADTAAILTDTGTDGVKVASLTTAAKAEVNAEVVDALATDIIADSVPADGTRPTIAQAAYMLVQFMLERAVVGTTVTVKKPDGTTSLFALTLDSATAPTTITRSS